MRWPWRKQAANPTSSPSEIDVKIVASIAGNLGIQMLLMRRETDELPAKARDAFSIGYVLGYCDGTLQVCQVHNEQRKRAVMDAVFRDLFGRQQGEIYVKGGIAAVARGDSDYLRGVQVGGEDAYKRLREKRDYALGWMFYVTGLRP